MFGGTGPALLGVCEVENEAVVARLAEAIGLPDRAYAVAAHASADARGIDTSFIFDSTQLQVLETGHQVVIKRSATRDIFWLRLQVLATGAEYIAIANHWPSRSAGQYDSEPFRILAAETHAYLVSQLLAQRHSSDGPLPDYLDGRL